MYRRKKAPDYIEPMPKKQLRRIIRAFEKRGGVVLMGDDVDAHLKKRNASAATLNAKTIMFRTAPGRADVFEELIHATQYRLGECDASALSVLECEIVAQEKLIRNAKAYKLTRAEIEQTKDALKKYRKAYEEMKREERGL